MGIGHKPAASPTIPTFKRLRIEHHCAITSSYGLVDENTEYTSILIQLAGFC